MFLRIVFTIIGLAVVGAGPAYAQQAGGSKSLGVFDAWTAYVLNENGQQVCYMVAKAHPAKNKKLKRGAAWLTITHRPGENSKDVVSYTSGYNFKPSSDVDIRIGKDSFNLFTEKDIAWSRDAKTDHELAAAIRKNTSLTLTGVPAARNAGSVVDALDVRGGAAAYSAIGKACGYPDNANPKPVVKKKANTGNK
jgi:hypothetical protein